MEQEGVRIKYEPPTAEPLSEDDTSSGSCSPTGSADLTICTTVGGGATGC